MFLKGKNQRGKTILVSCKYPYVINEVYKLLNNKNSTFNLKCNHLYPLYKFLNHLTKNGLTFEIINKSFSQIKGNINFYLALDFNKKDLKIIKYLKQKSIKFKSILLISEHPNYQIHNFINSSNEFDYVLSSYKLSNRTIRTFFPYVFNEVPFLEEKEIKTLYSYHYHHNEKLDSTMIYSNLSSFSISNYPIRRHMINVLSSIDNLKFKWFGRGWDISKMSLFKKKTYKYYKSNILQSPKLINEARESYGGELVNKNILLNVKTKLVIENFKYPQNYFSEKFIEPLIYGCLPIYLESEFPKEFYDYFSKKERDTFYAKNANDAIAMILKFSLLDIKETKKLSNHLRLSINKFIKENNMHTNLNKASDLILNELN